MQDPTKKLLSLRDQIDAIDKIIIAQLDKRADVALAVAEVKKQNGDVSFYRPDREAKVLKDKMANYNGKLPAKDVVQIFRDIMTACLSLQQIQTIAFLGPLGTYSHLCATKHFGMSTNAMPVDSITAVCRAVESGQANYGVLPIENSTGGVINETLDVLITTPLSICGEVNLPIQQNLLRQADDKAPIHTIYAHQQSLIQCREWLAANHPNVKQVAVSSNGYAAELTTKETGTAALASKLAGELHGLEVINANIEDNPKNTTRFVVVGKHKVLPSGDDKTSLLITTPHKPGSLISLLQPFADHNINITLIESRPYQHHNWSYIFFIDIEGHQQDDTVSAALNELNQQPIMYTVLGSYPKGLLS